ncbi:tyrosine-type recombinase/integrase [Brevibacterium sp. CT2-23B]|uniref:peptidoglycan-binding protein n=1 Tax=Brevibacterium sp. CT2-23B TaxID=2729630 RepID=UPI001556B3C6|nr:tyrosine-type recombinase/integrase [Brevibacterium sp. CT2-23B]
MSVKNLATGKLPWECLYPVMDGGQRKYKRKKFRTKREAEDFDREAYAKLDSSSNVDQSKAEKMTVEQLHQEWLQYLRGTGGRKNTGTAGNTLNRYDEIYRSVIEPRWGGAPLATVTDKAVRGWVEQGKFSSPSNKAKGVRQFSRLMNYAVGRYVAANTVKPYLKQLPKSEDSDVERYSLSMRQVYRIAACSSEHFAPIFVFLALTGLRFGELAALRGRDVENGALRVRRTQRTIDNKISYAEVTKGGERRTIPLTQIALDIAEARRRGRDDHLFTAPRGGDLQNQNVNNRALKPAVKIAASAVERLQNALNMADEEYSGDFHVYGPETARAVEQVQQAHGLPVTGEADPETRQALSLPDAAHGYTLNRQDSDFPDDFSLHGFRHTCVSLVVGAGANVKLAQSFAGHASAAMTLDTYSHLFADDLTGVAEALGRIAAEAQDAARLELHR